jgi:flavin-dependent thymidylate synthase
VTDAERMQFFDDLTKTTLNAAFETIDFHFMIEGVPRSFTHQLVRQRTAVYFQESMRFAVIDESFEDRVAVPPSLAGTVPWEQFVRDCQALGIVPELNASEKQYQRKNWEKAIGAVEQTYKGLVGDGMPAEEARGLLPTDILTRIHYKTNLRNLVDHAGLRLCTQAQFIWRNVFSQIARAIREADVSMPFPRNDGLDGQPGVRPNVHTFPVHMADQISDRLFRPICYQTGKCEFMASFDRACSIRDRVQANHAIGRPSSEWHEPHNPEIPFNRELEGPGGPEWIGPIYPAEWLMDDSAARS